MQLTWVLDDPKRNPKCGQARTASGKVVCELPWDHIVGGDGGPTKLDHHTGRNERGAWLSWT